MIQLPDDFYTVAELLELAIDELMQRTPDAPVVDRSFDGVPISAPSDQWRRSLAKQEANLVLLRMIKSGDLTPWRKPFRGACPPDPMPDYLINYCALDRSDAEKYLRNWIAIKPTEQPAPPVKETTDFLPDLVKSEISSRAKKAVSMRDDMVLKPQWMAHVQQCVARGDEIRNVVDLLNIDGYDPRLAHTPHGTLKKWAKEAVPTLKFKEGRPKSDPPK